MGITTAWSWEEDLEELEKETLRPEATRSASLGRRNMMVRREIIVEASVRGTMSSGGRRK